MLSGQLKRNAYVRLVRGGGGGGGDGGGEKSDKKSDDAPVGIVRSLRRHKDVVKEVGSNTECGVDVNGIADIRAGDVLECFELAYEPRKLGDPPPKPSVLQRLSFK